MFFSDFPFHICGLYTDGVLLSATLRSRKALHHHQVGFAQLQPGVEKGTPKAFSCQESKRRVQGHLLPGVEKARPRPSPGPRSCRIRRCRLRLPQLSCCSTANARMFATPSTELTELSFKMIVRPVSSKKREERRKKTEY